MSALLRFLQSRNELLDCVLSSGMVGLGAPKRDEHSTATVRAVMRQLTSHPTIQPDAVVELVGIITEMQIHAQDRTTILDSVHSKVQLDDGSQGEDPTGATAKAGGVGLQEHFYMENDLTADRWQELGEGSIKCLLLGKGSICVSMNHHKGKGTIWIIWVQEQYWMWMNLFWY